MKTLALPDMPQDVKAVFASYPVAAQAKFDVLREIIFEEAARLEVGALHETLKWGEPSYLTPQSKAAARYEWRGSSSFQTNARFSSTAIQIWWNGCAKPSRVNFTTQAIGQCRLISPPRCQSSRHAQWWRWH